MKVAPNLLIFFKDSDGFGTAISDALQPNPSSALRRSEEASELSLERYGINDRKASCDVVHFVDQDGRPQVTLLLLQSYEPPLLVCVLNEVLASIVEDNLSKMPTIVFPVIVSAAKLKLERKFSATSDRDPIYGVQIGPETDTTRALLAKCKKPPPSLQIQYEPLACFLQLARVLKLSTCVIIGQSQTQKNITDELKVIHEIGELLTSIPSLCFSKERLSWSPTNSSKDNKEPWRELYG